LINGGYMVEFETRLKVESLIKARLNPIGGKLINLMVSGSNLYGFNSKDSDIDWRGTYMMNTSSLLGLHSQPECLEIKDVEGVNDIVLQEIGKEIKLCLSGNCNAYEHLNGPQIVSTTDFLKLREMLNNAMGKTGLYNSYKGMAQFNYIKFVKTGRNTVKKYLYVFRGLMAGIYVLQTGQIQPNINELNKYFKIDEVKQLVKLKQDGLEDQYIPTEIDKGQFETKIADLFVKMDEAYMKCKMPEKPTEEEVEKINQQLIKNRREFL
jgi:uncharacterized protein